MKRKYVEISLIVLFTIFGVSACNRVKRDAKKSARYTNQSIEQAQELDFEKAQELYYKAEKIKQKYSDREKKRVKFNDLYRKYRDQDWSLEKND